jgi:hypothetical protein
MKGFDGWEYRSIQPSKASKDALSALTSLLYDIWAEASISPRGETPLMAYFFPRPGCEGSHRNLDTFGLYFIQRFDSKIKPARASLHNDYPAIFSASTCQRFLVGSCKTFLTLPFQHRSAHPPR